MQGLKKEKNWPLLKNPKRGHSYFAKKGTF
jgi:hypothetical protein